MTVGTTTTLSNSIRTQYLADYIKGIQPARLYDQFAGPVGMNMAELQKGSAIQVNYLSKLQPATATISQTSDVSPVTFRDATATITPTSRANAIQDSELLLLQTYTDYGAKRFQRVGENMMESVDLLAQDIALQGSNVTYVGTTARTSLDAGTSTMRMSDSVFATAASQLAALRCPWFVPDSQVGMGMPNWFALMPPQAYQDLRLGGNVVNVGLYQRPELIFNFEVGKVGPFTVLADPRAKVFYAGGAANGSAIETTLNGAVNALATSIVVTSASNIDVGDWLMIGTHETGNTHYPTNEFVRVKSVVSTTIGIIGQADNGGLMYDHVSGDAVSNDDNVYPVVFGGPESLAKVYAQNYIGDAATETSVGDYGTLVGPQVTGLVNQFVSIGWKYYGNYGRWSESWLLRAECSSSVDA